MKLSLLKPRTAGQVCFAGIAVLLALCAALLVLPFWGAAGSGGLAVYTRGILHLELPYHAEHDGAGQLTVEVLDPEDHVLGRMQKMVAVAEGSSTWKEQLKLDKPVPLDELVWHRVRYVFHYQDARHADLQDTESVSQILRMPVVHILGQQSYLAGSRAAVRVIVTDSNNASIGGRGSLRIDLQAGQKRQTLYSGTLNRRNTVEAQFQFPAGVSGNGELHYAVDTSIGSTEYTQNIRIEDKVGILLTTEKPIYQPGQTIHARALALNRADHEAVANRPLIFEVEDSRGNKVFKKATRTDEFGIASAEFELASEVNLGAYHLRALLGEAGSEAANTAEITLNVQKYVLPKFKVELNFNAPNEKKKHGYRPGDRVQGTVQANYFFGKPLDTAEVSLKATGMDVTTFQAASVEGKTDHDGAYHFDFRIPSYLAGRPISQGAARLLVEATVKDSAGHSETRGEPITVSESAFLLTAIPEGGTLVPGLENQVFLLASYPDGSPAQADLRVRADGFEQSARSDAGGVALINLKAAQHSETLQIEARDKEGETASASIPLEVRPGEDQVLLRSERAVYRAGEAIRLKVLSTKKQGTAYVDLIKDGQTILTRDLDITDGRAELSLVAGPEMSGTIEVNAYVFAQNAQPIADHRLLFVQPADELKIETVADAPVYKPGDETHIRFHITDSHGQAVHAALGLQIVDEAVFALAEKKPGFAKVFFYLEQEVMKPRYEIHAIGLPDVVEPVAPAQEEQRDRAARALFAATETLSRNKFEIEAGRALPQEKYGEYSQRYWARFILNANKVAEELQRSFANDAKPRELRAAFERLADAGGPEFRDAWGTRLKLEAVPWDGSKSQYTLSSAGMDRQFQTGDDMVVMLHFRRNGAGTSVNSQHSRIETRIAHQAGAKPGAEISGIVEDASEARVGGATITAKNISTGRTASAVSNQEGKFRLTDLLDGEYEVAVSSPGFSMAQGTFALRERDHAQLAVRLMVGSVSQTVEVTGASVTVQPAGTGFGDVVGIAGGAMGGVIGGMAANRREMHMTMLAPPTKARDLPINGRNFMQLSTIAPGADTSPDVHVRSYFPEALYINPEIITDRDGNASISIPLADNITTWRMTMLASTVHGALGTANSSLKVFQDFFVDLDLPVTLTQGDQISLPVAIYNYSQGKGEVRLQLKPDDWYALVGDAAEKSVKVDAGHVGGSQFTLEAKHIGKFKLMLSAQMSGGAKRADVVVREIEVVPNGREQSMVFNGQLESAASHRLEFPASSIAGASKIFVRLYPGPLSQIMEGMDALLRMPGGCFEQTSSSTYPNVLALDYMKRTKKLTPEVHAKAEGYIANGYQRLVTFEVPGGGFSWFGQAPANKILTSYGLMEFYDMSKVHDVDPRLIQRTQQWLASQQQADGSWKPDTSFINEGATNRYNSDVLRITAYIAWSLGNTGYHGPAVDKASQFVQNHLSAKMDAYTLAVLANFAVDYGQDRELTRQAMQLLLDARTEKDEQVSWSAEETGLYATGKSASVETTGLAVQALLKWGQAAGTARKALNYLTAAKNGSGDWGSTQATIMALRALLLAAEKGTADVRGTVEITVNGKPAGKLSLTSENNDLLHQFVFKNIEGNGENAVELRFEGRGALGYQVAGQYFIPWDQKTAEEALSISVDYDRTKLEQDDTATATATVRNNLNKTAKMVMLDLGIPPGFDLLSEDLQDYQDKSANQKSGRLEKFSLTATQAILYFDSFAAGETVQLRFRLRAKYPIRARTFRSRVYEYYDPEVSAVARPVQLEVRKR